MSDTRLRELEARFRKTGAIDDEKALILERVRGGQVSASGLQIACYCGHSVATMLVEQESPPRDLSEWVNNMPTLSQDAFLALRIAIIVSKQVRPLYEMVHPKDNRANRAIRSALSYLYDPNREKNLRVFEQIVHARNGSDIKRGNGVTEYPDDPKQLMASYAIEVIARALAIVSRVSWWNAEYLDYRTVRFSAIKAAKALELDSSIRQVPACELDSKQRVKQAICDSLIPWALGYKDPLLDLVAELEATSTTD